MCFWNQICLLLLRHTNTYLFKVRSKVNVVPKASSWKLAWARWTSCGQGDKQGLINTSQNKHMLLYQTCQQSLQMLFKKSFCENFISSDTLNHILSEQISLSAPTAKTSALEHHKSHSCAVLQQKYCTGKSKVKVCAQCNPTTSVQYSEWGE